VPLSRAAQLLPFLDFLDRLGTRIEPALEAHHLPANLRGGTDLLISTRAMATFVGEMARREGITDFGWRVSASGLAQVPVLSSRIRRSQTLLQALESVCEFGNRESSAIGVWIEDQEESIRFCFRGSMEVGAPGADEMSQMQAVLALSVVHCFADPGWTPPECALAMRGEPGPLVREALGDASVHWRHDFGWLLLPRSILARPPRARPPAPSRSGTGPDPSPDLVGSLVQTVRPYLARRAPPVGDVAELAGMSTRSLQRALAREGSSYREVVQRAKFEASRELLERREARVLDVAFETGFSDPAHFTRFFRSIAGVTPSEYRSSVLDGHS
jgi:AraC-like DNA-binding protein